MKITIKHYDIEVTWSNDKVSQKIDETTVTEAYEAFKGLLIASGYVKNSIDDYILEKAEELKSFEN